MTVKELKSKIHGWKKKTTANQCTKKLQTSTNKSYFFGKKIVIFVARGMLYFPM